MNTKIYSLSHFGGNRFALANETDKDVYTDYFPGYWGITSQKQAVDYCRRELLGGNEVVIGMGDKEKLNKVMQKI